MKSLALVSLMLLSSQAYALIPADLLDLTDKAGTLESNFGRGNCQLKMEGGNLVVYTNVAGIEKMVISKADKLIAINNSQYRSTRNGKYLCGKHGAVSDFRETISAEPDSLMLTRSYECMEKKKRIHVFCTRMR